MKTVCLLHCCRTSLHPRQYYDWISGVNVLRSMAALEFLRICDIRFRSAGSAFNSQSPANRRQFASRCTGEICHRTEYFCRKELLLRSQHPAGIMRQHANVRVICPSVWRGQQDQACGSTSGGVRFRNKFPAYAQLLKCDIDRQV